jgi:hypothetical protein
MKVVQDLAPNLAILRGSRVLKMMHIRRGDLCDTARLAILQLVYAELGHAASALVYLVADRPRHIELDNRSAPGTASVYPASLPCRPRQRFSPSASHYTSKKTVPFYKPNFNPTSPSHSYHHHIFIFSDPGIVVCISIYLPDLCFGGRQIHTHTRTQR